MKHLRIARGFSLLELIIVLFIVAVIATFASATFDTTLKRARQQSALSELVSLINFARNSAIQEQKTVTLCPLTPIKKCGSDWNRPLVAFRDPDRTKSITNESQILRVVQLNVAGHMAGKTGIRNYFRFRPSGLAEEAIGNIVWCPEDHDNRYAAQIRINMGGRPFVSKDSDNDGIVEDAYGNPVQCT
ncbi:GspH/FimT family pseudopilin [Marinobacter sp.]|uniref:GspH/FimT family pseudopilin n=1 Tax=Marinobacter sp. TaxID=50741 RepID=UPI003A8F9B41